MTVDEMVAAFWSVALSTRVYDAVLSLSRRFTCVTLPATGSIIKSLSVFPENSLIKASKYYALCCVSNWNNISDPKTRYFKFIRQFFFKPTLIGYWISIHCTHIAKLTIKNTQIGCIDWFCSYILEFLIFFVWISNKICIYYLGLNR